jgi:hypothetical protein
MLDDSGTCMTTPSVGYPTPLESAVRVGGQYSSTSELPSWTMAGGSHKGFPNCARDANYSGCDSRDGTPASALEHVACIGSEGSRLEDRT